MKEVTLKSKEDRIYLEDLNNDSIVGISFMGGKKCVVIQENDCIFTGITNDNLSTKTNWHSSSVQKYVKEFPENKTVFVFDSVKECFKWMSE